MSEAGRKVYEAFSKVAIEHTPFWPELNDNQRAAWDAAAESAAELAAVRADVTISSSSSSSSGSGSSGVNLGWPDEARR